MTVRIGRILPEGLKLNLTFLEGLIENIEYLKN